MNRLKPFFALLVLSGFASAQQYVITTVVGIPGVQGYAGDGFPAANAQLSRPFSVSVDSKNNLYICDVYTHTVRMVTASNGNISTLAGTGANGFSGDGAAANAAVISDPHGVAADANGNVYISDTSNNRIRKVDSKGIITTFAGNGTRGSGGDGADATKASLWFPAGLAVDGSGNVFVADYGSSTIRKITSAGAISTVAGTGTWGYAGDGGAASKATLANPVGVALDNAGNLFIADSGSNTIRKIGTDGNIRTVLSNVSPQSIAADAAGNVYFVETTAPLVRELLPSGSVITIAGTGVTGFNSDNIPALNAFLNFPTGVAVNSTGKVYVADSNNQVIRALTPVAFSVGAVTNAAASVQGAVSPGEIVTLFGSGIGPATPAQATVSNGFIGTQLAGVTVTFNGTPAPLLYVSSGVINAIAPYSIQSSPSTDIVVTYNGQTSATTTVAVTGAAPGIFTADTTGSGQAAALNENLSVNSPSNPAQVGSVLVLYTTGEGQTTPGGINGKLANATPYPAPVLSVKAQVGGLPAVINYAGAAPTLVAGVMQVNVQIPAGVQPGSAVPVSIQVGNATSQANVTVAITR